MRSLLEKPIRFLVVILCGLYVAMAVYGPATSLDTQLYYSGDQARSLINGTPEWRAAYLLNELIDLLFIAVYSTLFFIWAKRLFPRPSFSRWLVLIPGLADLVETSFIIYALKVSGPHSFFDWLGIATLLKWTTGGAVLLVLLWSQRRAPATSK